MIEQSEIKLRDKIAEILAKEMPVNYDGTEPGNYHILISVSKAVASQISTLLTTEMEKEKKGMPEGYLSFWQNKGIQACQDIVKKMCGA